METHLKEMRLPKLLTPRLQLLLMETISLDLM